MTKDEEVEAFLNDNSPRDSRYLTGYKAGYKDARTELEGKAKYEEGLGDGIAIGLEDTGGTASRAYNLGYKVGTAATRREADENMKNMVLLCEKYESELHDQRSISRHAMHMMSAQAEIIGKATQVIARYCLSANRWVGLGADINDLWAQLTPEEREEWIVKAAALIENEPLS